MPEYAYNKLAIFDYKILKKIEAGLVLSGQEVKSVKTGQMSLKGAYVIIQRNEAWLLNAHISPYKNAGPLPGYDPEQTRKLLLKRQEIDYLLGKFKEERLTLIPIRVYSTRGLIKLEIGLARSKKKFDKRQVLARKDAQRNIARALRIKE
ncbi:MAG: SsrA-binding protein [Candidatus Portnoybacteria bacterium CG10_big_fil_rev_8_21_14_0_10_36_7]|uniref:SsrA-binding protein n=1 Tax=Candidatus Portnoybacteria bacterium CG10_big_fil_rev_8_21_14_0_10_36_7 TaxID=1974812 RepID=A0A2M8KD87_9BACT|nr:MAG: SsrA-binding protein [Candidatus Portnoybacteria bacterium CG10_big_fil_rev_8_21_14_0_10_36_7]